MGWAAGSLPVLAARLYPRPPPRQVLVLGALPFSDKAADENRVDCHTFLPFLTLRLPRE